MQPQPPDRPILMPWHFREARRIVAEHYDVAPVSLTRQSRLGHLIEPRHVLWTVLTLGFVASSVELAVAANRDRATVRYGVQKVLARCAGDPQLQVFIVETIAAVQAAPRPDAKAA